MDNLTIRWRCSWTGAAYELECAPRWAPDLAAQRKREGAVTVVIVDGGEVLARIGPADDALVTDVLGAAVDYHWSAR